MLRRALLALLLTARACAQPLAIERVPAQASFVLEGALTDLSGLVWTGGDSYFAVSDKRSALLPVTLRVDRRTGAIESGEFGAPIPVPAASQDFEGIAFVASEQRFFISTEAPSAIVSFTRGDPRAKTLPLPPILHHAREHLGLESLTWDAAVKNFWTATEESLACDGPTTTPETGTLVRLVRCDARFQPLAQYAWRTETATMRYGSGNGLADLLLLPNGTLLVMERGFAGFGLQLRIFAADFSGATDVSGLASLDGAKFTPAKKVPLLDEPTGFLNFEGLALGPTLADGTRSLILVADSHGGTQHTFLPLKLRLPSSRK